MLFHYNTQNYEVHVIEITSWKTNSNTSNKSQDKYQVGIIRELDKESLMYCYSIYTIDI